MINAVTMYHRICGCVTLLLIGLSSSKDLQEADTDHYQSYEQAREVFQQYEAKYPSLAKMHSIGKTVQQRDLLVLQVYFCSTLVNKNLSYLRCPVALQAPVNWASP